MTEKSLEERVAALEKVVARLVDGTIPPVREGDWQRTVGALTGDEVMKRILDKAMRYRAADRRKARRQTRRMRAKS